MKYSVKIKDINKGLIRFYIIFYRITLTSKAVVCGGMLIVINAA